MLLNKIDKKQIKIIHIVFDIIYMVVGAFLIAVGTNLFLLPHRMTTGGASGIATIFYYLLNIPMGITIMLINIPLFIFSIIKLGIKFNIKTIYLLN